MRFLTNKRSKSLLIAGLSLACLGSFGTAVWAASHPQPPAINAQGQLPPGPPPDGKFGGMQESSNDASNLTAVKTVDGSSLNLVGQDLASSGINENVLLVRKGGSLTLTDSKLSKTGNSSSADASNFTGQNAIILANNSNAVLENLTLTSDADGANAIFATGKQAQIKAKHIKIHTKNNSSRGLDATYGGTITAEDVDITTEGAHCGALATDRGEGNVIVNGAKIHTSGEGSPCIYSTGNIQLTNGEGVATGSEIAVVEGKNSITLQNAQLTGHVKHGVMLYQSFSGDANVGVAEFTATDSVLNNQSTGPMFYITNTTAKATLENTTLNQSGDILVKVTSDRWGSSGKNGGDFTLNAKNQQLNGQILANNLSKVTLNLDEGSTFNGTINHDNQADAANISLTKDAKWQLTADAYVTTITDEQIDFSNIASNKHNIYYDKQSNPSLNGKTINLPGGGKLKPMH
ncbi:MAG: hypothetical protein E7201_10570 [Selenomonas ruminantium]|uniref:Uncharacterized protein n=1 Tax=Selenomonas ruminantium TaxID=971 RepID=A0A927WQ62_SELRU|nr:hypothetical protein [Selenomonas ruminantium]